MRFLLTGAGSGAGSGTGRRRPPWRRQVLAASMSLAMGMASAHAASLHVIVEAVQFSPATLEARAGDTITWENKDPFPHTVTSADKAFDSGVIAAGQSWTFHAGKPGVYPYVCTLHPGMKAVLVVK